MDNSIVLRKIDLPKGSASAQMASFKKNISNKFNTKNCENAVQPFKY